MKTLFLSMLAALLLAVPVTLPEQTGQRAVKPNILFLFADDMRADTIAAHGNPHIKTPHLDGLVRRGFSFRGNYIFGGNSGAVCVPSRAMLMSGKTWFHIDAPTLNGTKLLPELLGENGYVTFATGKWHNGQPSWLRAFQRGKAVMFGGMSDHTKVPVKDLGPDGKLIPHPVRRARHFTSIGFRRREPAPAVVGPESPRSRFSVPAVYPDSARGAGRTLEIDRVPEDRPLAVVRSANRSARNDQPDRPPGIRETRPAPAKIDEAVANPGRRYAGTAHGK